MGSFTGPKFWRNLRVTGMWRNLRTAVTKFAGVQNEILAQRLKAKDARRRRDVRRAGVRRDPRRPSLRFTARE